MKFTKYEERGRYHQQWLNEELDWYVACIDRIEKFCSGPTLDVGCGEGVLTARLPAGSVGIDSDPTAIELAQAFRLPCKKADLNDPIAGQWEFMACLNVIEHLERPERIVEIFQENITQAGIIITDQAHETPGKFHVHEFTLDELMELFKDFNPQPFTIEASETFIGVEIYR